jgi:hypothetical protein
MENPEIKIDLTLTEINMILASLGKHPFEDVVALVGKIKIQGEEQLKVLQEAAAASAEAAEAAEE